MSGKIIKVEKIIIPTKAIYKKRVKEIKKVDSSFVVKGYNIHLKNKKIDKVTIDSKHPNCNPENNELCIPDFVKNINLDKTVIIVIENLLQTFNLDSCYYIPWMHFRF